MSAIDWMPAFVALIVVTGGAIAYSYQKRIDQKNALLEMRRRLYQDFLGATVDQGFSVQYDHGDQKSKKNDTLKITAKMTVVASDEVLQCLEKYELVRKSERRAEGLPWGNLLLAMRKDIDPKSSISKNVVENAIPFGD